MIPLDRADPRGLAFLNILPLPNTTGSGYNYQYQEASIPSPRRSQVLRMDYRPTAKDTFSVKAQSWFTKSVGLNAAGVPTNGRWGLYRQRYDFDADQGKIDYLRVLGQNTVLEATFGVFDSFEDGPPENEQELAKLQRATFPALANLPQFAGAAQSAQRDSARDVGQLPEQRQQRLGPEHQLRRPVAADRQ